MKRPPLFALRGADKSTTRRPPVDGCPSFEGAGDDHREYSHLDGAGLRTESFVICPAAAELSVTNYPAQGSRMHPG